MPKDISVNINDDRFESVVRWFGGTPVEFAQLKKNCATRGRDRVYPVPFWNTNFRVRKCGAALRRKPHAEQIFYRDVSFSLDNEREWDAKWKEIENLFPEQ